MVGDDQAIAANGCGLFGIVGIENPFDDEVAIPFGADAIDIGPGDGRVKVGAKPTPEVIDTRFVAENWCDIAELVGAAEQANIPRPVWAGEDLADAGEFALQQAAAR